MNSKLPHIGTTIFTTMSALAVERGAVNLGQGFPDFHCDPRLVEALNDAASAGYNQYPPMAGVAALRERVVEKVSALYGREYDVASEITITAGATQAIHTAITALVRPGDEVIIFEPVYDSYEPSITMNGGKAVYVTLNAPDYRPDWAAVRASITPRTRAILINTPHNPTATCWPAEDMRALADLLKGTDIVVISDEVYEHMVYDDQRHESVARYPALAERAIVISSFGKTYHVTGWKIAYALAPRELMTEFRKAHQFIVFTVHTPSQHALAAYMAHGTHLTLPAFYQAKRDLFREAVRDVPLAWMPSPGTYFMSAGFRHLEGYREYSDLQFAEHLTREVGVACIPLSAFYREGTETGIVRFCFAKKDETLREAAGRLRRLDAPTGGT
ncbi:MAG: methionine aminotransferase [Burkholderiales bacterium]|nr:methionine aminotransferase [Burkholderiales bacterium]